VRTSVGAYLSTHMHIVYEQRNSRHYAQSNPMEFTRIGLPQSEVDAALHTCTCSYINVCIHRYTLICTRVSLHTYIRTYIRMYMHTLYMSTLLATVLTRCYTLHAYVCAFVS
jgi:hypothetical protein